MIHPEHVYGPKGSALELFRCRANEVLLSGPAGTGKSRACLEKIHAMMLKTPGARGLIVRKTAASLGSSALVTFREHVAAAALESGEMKFYGGSPQEAASYQYGNGSVIVVGGMDKPGKVMSTEYDVIYVQEAIELTEDDWEALTSRLRNGKISFQQLMADTNPGPPHHWLKKRADRGETVIINCRHEDNPRMWTGEDWTPEGSAYLDRLKALTGVRRLRLLDGKWAAAEGLIYDTFDPLVHMHKHIGEPPHSWDRWLSIDFGFRNPFTCQWWTVDSDGRAYLYREIYMTGRLVEDHAKTIARHMKARKDEPLPRGVVCDHDAEGRATLERHLGIATIPAIKKVTDGIQAVQERLNIQKDGRPRLYVCRDALVERDPVLDDAKKPACLAEELTGYVWADTNREQPVKADDHGCDAMRYLVAQLDMGGMPNVRVLGDEAAEADLPPGMWDDYLG